MGLPKKHCMLSIPLGSVLGETPMAGAKHSPTAAAQAARCLSWQVSMQKRLMGRSVD